MRIMTTRASPVALPSTLFTLSEAAWAANAVISFVKNEVDKKVVITKGADLRLRLLDRSDLSYLRAVRQYHGSITIGLRKQIYADLCKAVHGTGSPKPRVTFDTFVIRLRPILHEIDERIIDIQAARDAVQIDPEVRGGEPTVRNTRIPVHALQEMVQNGAARRDLANEYELTTRQIDLALLYAELHPRRGRPARTGLDDDLPDFGDVARVDIEELGDFGNRDLPIA